MLDNKGFDLWADEYDKSVELSDSEGTYPFAGYKNILSEIYQRVLLHRGRVVLDIGFGTGILTTKLYEQGCDIYGQDFSEKMIAIAKKRMPKAKLYCGDISHGLVEELKQTRYDAIIANYSLHHLTDMQKVIFLNSLWPLLSENGCIYIGDVAFETREELDKCKKLCEPGWDDDEFYFVAAELKKEFPTLRFEPFSHCAGVITLGI